MSQKVTLRCKSNAFIKGEGTVKAGKVDTYPSELANQLLASGRFEQVEPGTKSDPEPEQKPATKQANKGG